MAPEKCQSGRVLPPRRHQPLRSCKRLRSQDHPHPTPFTKLGDDMLIEVLVRVPEARNALCCKTVCKRWNALISDRSFAVRFVRNHRRWNGDDKPLTPSESTLSFIPLPDELQSDFRVLDSFKDLLLCGFEDIFHTGNELGRTYLVCNPFTKQWIPLPVAPAKSVRYTRADTRLVCEPRSNNSDDDSEYRFRVVCIYQSKKLIKLDVFCSESGNWTKEARVVKGQLHEADVVSNNGEMFWWCVRPGGGDGPLLYRFNPFRLDESPALIDASAAVFAKSWWNVAVSRSALHVVAFDQSLREEWSRSMVRVWRLDENHRCWSQQCEMMLENSPDGLNGYSGYDWAATVLHSKMPEVVFLGFADTNSDEAHCGTLSFNFRSGEIEEFGNPKELLNRWRVFELWKCCWPTSIPRYNELRGIYNGRYMWLV